MGARGREQRCEESKVAAVTSKGAIDVRFYFEGRLYAQRAWHTVPNAGELVMLSPQPGKEALIAFKITGRIFMGDGAAHNRQLVNVYIEREVL